MLYSGVTGKISIQLPGGEEKELVYANNFSVSTTRNIREVVRFGKNTKEKRPGMKDWTASGGGMADFSPDGGQRELRQAYEDGLQVVGTFYLQEGVYLRGACLIESLDIGLEADGDATLDISMSGIDDVEMVYTGDESQTPGLLRALTVLSIAGTGVDKTVISVTESPEDENVLVYKIGLSAMLVSYNQILSTWDVLPPDGKLNDVTEGHRVTVAEVDANNRAKAAGNTTIVTGG